MTIISHFVRVSFLQTWLGARVEVSPQRCRSSLWSCSILERIAQDMASISSICLWFSRTFTSSGLFSLEEVLSKWVKKNNSFTHHKSVDVFTSLLRVTHDHLFLAEASSSSMDLMSSTWSSPSRNIPCRKLQQLTKMAFVTFAVMEALLQWKAWFQSYSPFLRVIPRESCSMWSGLQ